MIYNIYCNVYRHVLMYIVLVTQSCPTLCNPMDCSPLGSSVHLIFQARILECAPMPSPRRSCWFKFWTHVSCVSCIGRQILYPWCHLGSRHTFSEWIEALPTRTQTTAKGAKVLKEITTRSGLPGCLQHDNGPAFGSQVTKGMMRPLVTRAHRPRQGTLAYSLES